VAATDVILPVASASVTLMWSVLNAWADAAGELMTNNVATSSARPIKPSSAPGEPMSTVRTGVTGLTATMFVARQAFDAALDALRRGMRGAGRAAARDREIPRRRPASASCTGASRGMKPVGSGMCFSTCHRPLRRRASPRSDAVRESAK
jgi:hypothetical protein